MQSCYLSNTAFMKNLAAYLGLALALGIKNASACSVPASAYELDAFLASSAPHKVVFTARVVAVANKNFNTGVTVQDIELETFNWYRGQARKRVKASGVIGSMRGTSCEGQFDFHVRQGEEWLIVGEEEKGVIIPSGMLSEKIKGGRPGAEALRSLSKPAR